MQASDSFRDGDFDVVKLFKSYLKVLARRETDAALKRLQAQGFIKQDESGKWVPTEDS